MEADDMTKYLVQLYAVWDEALLSVIIQCYRRVMRINEVYCLH